jgi:hypothetical protein
VDYKKFKKNYFYKLAVFLKNPYFLIPSIHYYGKKAISKGSKKKLDDFKERIKIEAVVPGKEAPGFYIGKLGTLMAEEKSRPFDYEKIKVWFPLKKIQRNICPAMHVLGSYGKFSLDFKREAKRNLLVVSNSEPGKEGKRLCRLGFSANKKGFNLEIPGGKTIHLLVEVNIPGHLINKDNFLFIRDFDGKWERKRITFSGTGWLTYLASKKIHSESTKLQLGIQFAPLFPEDKLRIKDVKVFISGESL